MTILNKISGPYTSVHVGAYQPVFLRWLSSSGMRAFVTHLVRRVQVVQSYKDESDAERASIVTAAMLDPWSDLLAHFSVTQHPSGEIDDLSSLRLSDTARSIHRAVGDLIRRWTNPAVVSADPFRLVGQGTLEPLLLDLKLKGERGLRVPVFWPGLSLAESLSPIGMLHLYRHYYFNLEEGVGPIEQALTLAPRESVEVVLQTTRRVTLEEQRESTTESESERSSDERATDEISDRVSSMIEKSKSTSVSASGGASVGVFEAKGSVSTTQSQTSRNTREQSTRSVKELTNRASERLKKSFSIRTRSLQEFSATNTTRRTINNPDPDPVNYGLRRVFRRMSVRVQDVGPRMVWQLYVHEPGGELGQPIFLDHRQLEQPIFPVERPVPGEDEIITGGIGFTGIPNGRLNQPFTFTIPRERKVTHLRLISSRIQIGNYTAPGGDVPWTISIAEAPVSQSPEGLITATVYGNTDIGLVAYPAIAVSFHIRYVYEPTQDALKAWDQERLKWQTEVLAPWLDKQFEIRKSVLQRSAQVSTRPSDDLRREERFEIMKLISQDVLKLSGESGPTEIEAEGFHRYFDIESMFYFCHPAWWKPRNARRTDYEITDEMPPSKFGSSLGWLLQLDGDRTRNEFLNSPFVRVCIPINEGQEREAVAWLASHVEGWLGLGDGGGPLNALTDALLSELEKILLAARFWTGNDPSEMVTASASINTGLDVRPWLTRVEVIDDPTADGGRKLVWKKPKRANEQVAPDGSAIVPVNLIYPLFNEYFTTVPVDGFVYEKLDVQT